MLVARLRAALESARDERESVERDRDERKGANKLIEIREAGARTADSSTETSLHAVLRNAEPDCSDLEEAFPSASRQGGKRRNLLRQKQQSDLREDPRFAAFESDPRVVAERPPTDAPWLVKNTEARETANFRASTIDSPHNSTDSDSSANS